MHTVQILHLEVTKRCNMKCEHCLRGKSQKRDMDKATIDSVLNTFDHIWKVHFDGGEPTLNLEIIEYFFEQALKLNKMPGFFYITTNGKEKQKELADILSKYYPHCKSKNNCIVAISRDSFHEAISDNHLETLEFYSEYENHEEQDDREWLVDIGNTRRNNLLRNEHNPREFKPLDIAYYMNNDRKTIDINFMYITTDGDVIADPEHSYAEEEDCILCHIDNLKDFVTEEIYKHDSGKSNPKVWVSRH